MELCTTAVWGTASLSLLPEVACFLFIALHSFFLKTEKQHALKSIKSTS